MPVRADAPSAPDLSQVGSIGPAAPYETQRGPDLSKIGKVGPEDYNISQRTPTVSAAETHTAPSSQYKLQGKEREREQDELIERITGSGGKSNEELGQERALRSWTSNMTDVNDPNLRIMENWKKQQLINRGAQ
jgi:hypothetical protein